MGLGSVAEELVLKEGLDVLGPLRRWGAAVLQTWRSPLGRRLQNQGMLSSGCLG